MNMQTKVRLFLETTKEYRIKDAKKQAL